MSKLIDACINLVWIDVSTLVVTNFPKCCNPQAWVQVRAVWWAIFWFNNLGLPLPLVRSVPPVSSIFLIHLSSILADQGLFGNPCILSYCHMYIQSGMFNENPVFCSKQHVFVCLINLKVVCLFFLLKFNSSIAEPSNHNTF